MDSPSSQHHAPLECAFSPLLAFFGDGPGDMEDALPEFVQLEKFPRLVPGFLHDFLLGGIQENPL